MGVKANKTRWVGCYTDNRKRDLRSGPHKYGYNNNKCNLACQRFKYFALQNNGMCVCDNKYKRAGYSKRPAAECRNPCKGEPRGKTSCGGGPCYCGGSCRNAVYVVKRKAS